MKIWIGSLLALSVLASSSAMAFGGKPVSDQEPCATPAKYTCKPDAMARANGFEQLSLKYCENFAQYSTVQHGEAMTGLLKFDSDLDSDSNTVSKLYFDAEDEGEVPSVLHLVDGSVKVFRFSAHNVNDDGVILPTPKQDYLRNIYANFSCVDAAN